MTSAAIGVDPVSVAYTSDGRVNTRRVTPANLAKMMPPVTFESRTSITDPSTVNSSTNDFQILHVSFTKGTQGLGFSIYCGSKDEIFDSQTTEVPDDRPVSIYVRRLAPGGAAEMDGRIRVNDQILEVDSQSLVNISYAQATEILRNTSGQVTLRLARPLDSSDGQVVSSTKAQAAIVSEAQKPRESADIDINCNDNSCKNQHKTSALRKRLHEAQKRTALLTEQLNRAHDELAKRSSSGDLDDVMTDRLVEAETATKKAQRHMITLQTSLNASKNEYIEMETEFRCKVNELSRRCNETEDIARQYREKDSEYNAERAAIRQRHVAKEKENTQQIMQLQEKLRQLESNAKHKSDGGDVVLLLKQTPRISIDEPVQQMTSSRRSLSTSSGSDDDPNGAIVSQNGAFKYNAAVQPMTSVPRQLLTAPDNDSISDTWSITRQKLDEEPPSYPPPPPPPEAEDVSDRSTSDSDTDEEEMKAESGLRRNESKNSDKQGGFDDNVRAVANGNGEDVSGGGSTGSRPGSSRGGRGAGAGHRRTDSSDKEQSTVASGDLVDGKKHHHHHRHSRSSAGMKRIRRIFVPKSSKSDPPSPAVVTSGDAAARTESSRLKFWMPHHRDSQKNKQPNDDNDGGDWQKSTGRTTSSQMSMNVQGKTEAEDAAAASRAEEKTKKSKLRFKFGGGGASKSDKTNPAASMNVGADMRTSGNFNSTAVQGQDVAGRQS
jgi:hypothetical protein